MDVRFFLDQRLIFIQQLYLNGVAPFEERKRKIEAEEEPFVPPYSEDAEPAFQIEWMEANASIQVLGSACLSMLSASLHLFFTEWERRLGPPPGDSIKAEFKRGWPNGYRAFFKAHWGVRFEDGPCDFGLLEELVLARNQIQHPDSLVFESARYSASDLERLSSPFFISDRERELISEVDTDVSRWLIQPSIDITSEKLLHALSEVRKFVEWLEKEGQKAEGGERSPHRNF